MISLGVTNFDATVTVQVVTRGADTYSATGRAIKGVEAAPEDIQADIQPLSNKDNDFSLSDLPEGIRNEVVYVIWTPYDLQTDHVIFRDGKRFRVYRIAPRREDGFTKAAIGILKS